uniref:peroxiredoxin-5, mitochondrial n=1 Tax=Pristiophorus japonicus TaxID=55135 RepID=UPI00398F3E3D
MRLLLCQRLRGVVSCSHIHRDIHRTAAAAMPFKVGDKLPSIDVHEEDPHTIVNIAKLFENKKGVLFGVPGAFTPACSKTHLPSYLKFRDELTKKGIEIVACVAVNDSFVMKAWAAEMKTEGKVRMLADPTGALTRALNLELDKEQLIAALGNKRCKRFVMLVENGVVTKMNVEEDGTGLSCSLANHAMEFL